MIYKIWSFLVIARRCPKIWIKKQLFRNNATFINGNNNKTTFGITAYCLNETGDKNSIVIGDYCDLHARISACGKDARIEIGNNTTIRYNSVVGAVESIVIGDNVIISNNVSIYDNNNHPTNPEIRLAMTKSGFYGEPWRWTHSAHKPVVIEDNVWIDEHSTILKGVTIGKGSIIGCHSVVTKDIPPYCIAAGNPAKVVKNVKE